MADRPRAHVTRHVLTPKALHKENGQPRRDATHRFDAQQNALQRLSVFIQPTLSEGFRVSKYRDSDDDMGWPVLVVTECGSSSGGRLASTGGDVRDDCARTPRQAKNAADASKTIRSHCVDCSSVTTGMGEKIVEISAFGARLTGLN